MICFDCGFECEVRKTKEGILLYNSEEELWQSDCPSCGSTDFYVRGQEYL